MSIVAACTCPKRFGYVFDDYVTYCPRHGSTAKWLQEKRERRATELLRLRERALTRPAHGGYPATEASVEIDRDTEGELLIDWSPGKGRMLTLSMRADGRLSYAFTWDGEKAHGIAQMPPAAGVPGCERCHDTGWHYRDAMDPNSLEPCCEKPAAGVAPSAAVKVGPPWCCEQGERLNVNVCPECDATSRAYSAAAGVGGPLKEGA